MTVIHASAVIDLANFYQRAEAAGLFFRVADSGCKGSVEYAWMTATLPYDWRPALDGRTAEMKAFAQAERDVIKALGAYDRARFAAKAKAGAK